MSLVEPVPEEFKAIMLTQHDDWKNNFQETTYKPKAFGPDDVDLKILACGVCGSDLHSATGGWGQRALPVALGHEIIGIVLRVGENVQDLKVGDRAGVGAQAWSCLDCRQCKSDNEPYCNNYVGTYGSFYPTGEKSQGGYSSHVRVHNHFVFPIPDGLETNHAAPFMCAGTTVFSPLKRNGCGPGKKVGVIGIGGLGHFAVMFAKAMGADVYAFSTSPRKEEDVKKMGGKFILTQGDGWNKEHIKTFDLIINSADSTNFDLQAYLLCLDVQGRFINVGLGDDPLPPIYAKQLLKNACLIGGSLLGSRKEILEMLELAVKCDITSWIETIPVSKAGVVQALSGLENNQARYRYVLTDFEAHFAESEKVL